MTGKELMLKLSAMSDDQQKLPVTFVNDGCGFADGRVLVSSVELIEPDEYDLQIKDFNFNQLIEIG